MTDHVHNLTVIFEPTTNLPYLVRAYEDHFIFGPSTNDLVLYNYTVVEGLAFPRRIKIMYNEQHMLFDSIIGHVDVNPSFPVGYFDGLSEAEIGMTEFQTPPTQPQASTEYGDAEVTEFRYDDITTAVGTSLLNATLAPICCGMVDTLGGSTTSL